VATVDTFDLFAGNGLAIEWRTSPTRSWYTTPYILLTTAPTGAKVHVPNSATWGRQPRFVVQLQAVTGKATNSGLKVFAQNRGELIHLSETVPGEDVPEVLDARFRLELGPRDYRLFYQDRQLLSGPHGLRPGDWPKAHLQYVTMYNSGTSGNRYKSGLRSVYVRRIK